MTKKNQHVTPHREGEWQIKGAGNDKATKIVPTQKEAIEIARTIANNNNSEVVIHGKDGKIRDSDSYGNDPKNIKDTKF
jgi:stress response protein YsnF